MDVTMMDPGAVITSFNLADEFGLCPKCGATMKEIDRLKENSSMFIWLACARSECGGQWLQKKLCRGWG